MSSIPTNDKTLDLLDAHVTVGLSDQEHAELRDALGADADEQMLAHELAAAAIDLSTLDTSEPMPDALRASLGAMWSGATPTTEPSAPALRLTEPTPEPVTTPTPVSFAGTLGWVAAAACLTLAAVVWMGRPALTQDPLVQRSALLNSASDVITASWIGVEDLGIGAPDHALDAGVAGDVVWSDATNKGVMRISGIESNDPSEFQYQLWIFDAQRRTGDLPHFAIDGLPDLLTQRPVDGGVFDVAPDANGETLVPVDAKLPVGQGVIFAVTKEKPGGVVVSDREIVFLAIRG